MHRITDLLSLGRNGYFFTVTLQEVKERKRNKNVNIALSIPCSYDEAAHLVKSSLAAKFYGYAPLVQESNRTRVIWIGGTTSYTVILSPGTILEHLIGMTFQKCKGNLLK